MTRILLSNDDSYLAEGLRRLVAELASWATVVVVVPESEQSGTSHSITLHRPLRLRPWQSPDLPGEWLLVDGTPTDCVNLGLHQVMVDNPPDLVVSGINHGVNVGDDVSYSGTVGAALEGYVYGFPSVALSQQTDREHDFAVTAAYASNLLRALVERELPPELLLNVNFPGGPLESIEVTRLGRRVYRDVVQEGEDPRGRPFYWISGKPDWEATPGTDQEALLRGCVSVTPLRIDVTNELQLEKIAELFGSLRFEPGGPVPAGRA